MSVKLYNLTVFKQLKVNKNNKRQDRIYPVFLIAASRRKNAGWAFMGNKNIVNLMLLG
jgi:hypothetical protein